MMELVPATTTEVATDIQPAVASGDLWKPVISDLQALGEEHGREDMSWIYIFITGFLGGLLALFTLVYGTDYSDDSQFLLKT